MLAGGSVGPSTVRATHPAARFVPSAKPRRLAARTWASWLPMTTPEEAVSVVQKQLEAYNKRDLEAFLATFDECVEAVDAETGAIIASSKEELRPRYVERFKNPALRCELIGRLSMGNVVVDREVIHGLPNDTTADCLATYTVSGGRITKARLLFRVRGVA